MHQYMYMQVRHLWLEVWDLQLEVKHLQLKGSHPIGDERPLAGGERSLTRGETFISKWDICIWRWDLQLEARHLWLEAYTSNWSSYLLDVFLYHLRWSQYLTTSRIIKELSWTHYSRACFGWATCCLWSFLMSSLIYHVYFMANLSNIDPATSQANIKVTNNKLSEVRLGIFIEERYSVSNSHCTGSCRRLDGQTGNFMATNKITVYMYV